MTKDDLDNGMSWLRKNLAVFLAAFSMVASIGGWYASYVVLAYRVSVDAAAILVIQTEQNELVRELHIHDSDTAKHMDPGMQKEFLSRMTRIENLLIEHMSKRAPEDK